MRPTRGGGTTVTDYTPLEAEEFAYDSPRARWLSRAVQADSFERLSGPASWTDSVGDSPYLDFDVTPNASGPTTITNVTRYAGTGAYETVSSGAKTYLHGDLIESTIATTNGSGALNTGAGLSATAYSAFGENVTAGGVGVPPANLTTRYAYAGGHGYESGLLTHAGVNPLLAPITLQHLGYRWYQPDIGRFVQRDPIGLAGGINLYVYCNNESLACVDPQGLGPFKWIYTGKWNATDEEYDTALTGAAEYLCGGKQSNATRATQAAAGTAVGVGVTRVGGGRGVGYVTAAYGAWRLSGGSTGFATIDDALDCFAAGATAGAAFTPARPTPSGPVEGYIPGMGRVDGPPPVPRDFRPDGWW